MSRELFQQHVLDAPEMDATQSQEERSSGTPSDLPAEWGGEKKRAFFFIGDGRRSYQGYSHSAVLVAEGLAEMGWEILSNVPLWRAQPGGALLFPGGGLDDLERADLIFFAEDYFLLQGSDELPPIPKSVTAPKIYLDRSDLTRETSWSYGGSLRQLDMVFRCHSSGFFNYPDHFRPLAFGITRRMAQAAAEARSEKEAFAVWNFNRASRYPHTARVWAERRLRPKVATILPLNSERSAGDETISPYEALMRLQTDGKHFSSYHRELGRALACCCIGGWFLAPVQQQEAGAFCLQTRRLLRRVPLSTRAIGQWDSWRLWEAFAAGCVVLHFDFEESRFVPGGPMPEAMKHYIPVSRNEPGRFLEVLADTERAKAIGEAGRRWALEHYSAVPIVRRMLRQLGEEFGGRVTALRSQGDARLQAVRG